MNRAGFIGVAAGLAASVLVPRAEAASESPVLPGFHGIRVAGMARISWHRAARQSVMITGSPALLKRVRLTVTDGMLDLRLKSGIWSGDDGRLQLVVATPHLDRLDVSGMASGTVSGLDGPAFAVNISGTGRLTLSGAVTKAAIAVSGAGRVDAAKLIADDLTVSISGTGTVNGYARQDAHIAVNGVGSVRVAGHPAVRDVSNSGVGSVVFD
ncbi:GIN domain-containing protein [Acidiphilium acidophilum]|uniref:GIN domain-containing protein n=1 Tax=Acidiphilium acidophilum TaxID=76588 RepID=UPI002E8E6671|nr:DUF2807 domain-containing protein [Acidiphilium acidophilum]